MADEYDPSSDTYWPAVEPDYPSEQLAPGVYPDPGSPTGYADINGNQVDSTGQPVKYDSKGQLIDSNGNVIGQAPAPDTNNPNNKTDVIDPNKQDAAGNPLTPDANTGLLAALNKALGGTKITAADLAKLGVGAGALAGLAGLNKNTVTKVGYQGTIPELQANRNMMTAPPAGHRPGSGGINYGGDVVYSPKGTAATAPGGSVTPQMDEMGKGETLGLTPEMIKQMAEASKNSKNPPVPFVSDSKGPMVDGPAPMKPKYDPTIMDDFGQTGPRPAVMPNTGSSIADLLSKLGGTNYQDLIKQATERGTNSAPAINDYIHSEEMAFPGSKTATPSAFAAPKQYAAQGGIMGLAHGGRYLQGTTDGMADKLPTSIDGKQPAALSHGEFVIPADVVSHLGNGNSDAGAQKLYSMMDKIRMARTGTKKQGKQINPDKFMPGGLAHAYAQGGEVRHFATGDSVPAGTTGVEQTLAGWTGNYVPNMLAQGQALANAPYQQYQGPLTAGTSDLQNQAFAGASNLQTPTGIGEAANTAGNISQKAQGLSYNPQTTSFDATQAQKYMNPFLQTSLNPQLDEARRQSQIDQQMNIANSIKSGAFGGGAGDVMNRAAQRDLGSKLAGITGQGYNTAYTNAMQQFNADQARQAQEAQFGANYGLQGLQTGLQAAQAQGQLGATQNQANLANISEQANLGNQQRGIESEGIAADKKAFEEARDNPYKMLQFQQSLLNGLPISATNYEQAQPSGLTSAAAGATTVDTLLKALGLSASQPTANTTAATGK